MFAQKNKELALFKKNKPIISTKTGRELVKKTCSSQELMWIDNWLENLVRSRSLPPQCRGKDAFNALTLYCPTDVLTILDSLRSDFLCTQQYQPSLENFDFLLSEMTSKNL